MHEESLGDGLVVAQMSAPRAAGFEGMHEGPLDEFTAQAHQRETTTSVLAWTIRVHGVALHLMVWPFLPPTLKLGDVRAPAFLLQRQ